MRVRFLSRPSTSISPPFSIYTAQAIDLGGSFLDDLDHAVALLGEHPRVGAPLDGEIRRLLLRRFHHSLETDEVVILAVQHQSRHPDSWRKSL